MSPQRDMMSVGRVSTHVVHQHLRLRRRLPRLATYAREASSGSDHDRERAARHALGVLEQDVLAHAAVEDALIETSRHGAQAETVRLRTDHDALRDAAERLRVFVADPDPQLRVGGLLRGLDDLLRAHVEHEWRALLPLLSDLDRDRANELGDELTSTRSAPHRAASWLLIPASFELARQRLSPSELDTVAIRLAQTARAAVARVGHDLDMQPLDPIGLNVDLASVVSGREVIVLVGWLRSAATESVLAPVEFEVSLVRKARGPRWRCVTS